MTKIQKTNAMRLLDRENYCYETDTYDSADGKIDGVSVALKLGVDPSLVYKTLVMRANTKELLVALIPVRDEVDLKKLAAAAGVKSVLPVHVKELKDLTGYERGGCSPIGMKKKLMTFIEESVELLDKVYVSAGRIGAQIVIDPGDLIEVTEGLTVDLVKGQ